MEAFSPKATSRRRKLLISCTTRGSWHWLILYLPTGAPVLGAVQKRVRACARRRKCEWMSQEPSELHGRGCDAMGQCETPGQPDGYAVPEAAVFGYAQSQPQRSAPLGRGRAPDGLWDQILPFALAETAQDDSRMTKVSWLLSECPQVHAGPWLVSFLSVKRRKGLGQPQSRRRAQHRV
ncbi:hypothetical protein HDV57DRAFT_167765 [Trichoderma longibrachiatum]